jgi:molybdopterin converting factor small subunit
MSIRVLFFGATSAITGKNQIDVDATDRKKAADIFDHLLNEYPLLTQHKLLFAVNQRYSTGEETVGDGDELAIFTAVSGG